MVRMTGNERFFTVTCRQHLSRENESARRPVLATGMQWSEEGCKASFAQAGCLA